MPITIEKIPGGLRVDGLDLRNGKCGCTTVLPCCYSWSKVKQRGNQIFFTAKLSGPDSQDIFHWSYAVRKEDITVEVSVEDARDKAIYSGYFPPSIEEWVGHGWEIIQQEGKREDYGVWRCPACRRLYREGSDNASFDALPDTWICPTCRTKKDVFEEIG